MPSAPQHARAALLPRGFGGISQRRPTGFSIHLCYPRRDNTHAKGQGEVLLLSHSRAPNPKPRALSSPAPTAALHSSAGRAPDVFLYVSGLNLFICSGRAACTVLPLLPRRFCHLFPLWEFMAQNTSDSTGSVSFLLCSYGCCAAL